MILSDISEESLVRVQNWMLLCLVHGSNINRSFSSSPGSPEHTDGSETAETH